MTSGSPSPRARPRSAVQERRLRISDAATGLFIENGFDQVSIADIANAAGVSKMTVTNHFPLKEDLVFDQFGDELDQLGSTLRGERTLADAITAAEQYCIARETGGPVTAALRGRWRPDGWRLFAIMVAGSRVLTARFHVHYVELRDVIVEELPSPVTGVRRTTAAWMIAEAIHLIDWWPLEQAVAGESGPAAIDTGRRSVRRQAFAALRRGLVTQD
ncbi:TetR/AcrR family transcriptional regulator [Microlunatus sp. Gsoil 973]|jgi:AcrR family transcriptional regulator|uniref:TetR/AcrR family transcriptional regulator n=1 Tax=Microlunatus sp. Gsoil 973 TaxID=2672569 RepID=UPI0012B4EC2E|nr:TetR/AcrR family transcriptional regulator [Microlunatus sp. Gsoil 973]QGN33382.1 TetR family transcriptional regulator [Microlunatus sp. Gsoil 973]